jgi:hypothetical protein
MVSVASQTYSVTNHATTASNHSHNCCRSCGARQVAGSHGRGSNRARVLQLLVVPPEWDDRGARHAMRIAAMPSNVKSAATILSESEDQHRAGLLSHRDDDGGTNPTLRVDRNPADLARRAATAGPSSGRSVGAGPTAARTQSTVAHDVVRQGRLGGERGGEGAGSGAAGVGSRCIRGSQMAGTVVLSGGAPERRPTAWVRLGQRAKRIAPVYITGRTRRPARALPRRGTGWAGSS